MSSQTVGVHEQHATDPFSSTLHCIQDRGPALQDAGIDPEKGQRTDIGIVHDLEGQSGKRFVISAAAFDQTVGIRQHAANMRDIARGRQIIDDGVQQGLNALVLEGGTAQNRHEGAADRTGPDAGPEGIHGRVGSLKIGFQRRLILFDRGFDQRRAIFRRLAGERFRNILDFELGAELSSSQRIAFIDSRSMTPAKSDSCPRGNWQTSGTAPSRSRIISTQRKKSAPTRSILLTKQTRGTWYLSPGARPFPTAARHRRPSRTRRRRRPARAAPAPPRW